MPPPCCAVAEPQAAGPLYPGSLDRAASAALHLVRFRPKLHLGLPPHSPPCRASDAVRCQATRLVAVLLVRPFALRLLRPLLTSRSGSSPSPFQAQGEISPGKNAILPRATAGFTPPGPWPRELRGPLPARPARRRLISGSCSSARGFAPRFLPTLGHPHAVALRFARCGQLAGGLAPPRSRPCWAHNEKALARARAP
jgi:hypothetical protein